MFLYYREERIVHVNVSWVTLTGYAAVDCEGKVLSSLFHETTDAKHFSLYNNLVDNCLKSNKEKLSYSDDNSKDFSAYSTDSESSDDTQTISMPKTANIILSSPSKAPVVSAGFQFNPWGAAKISNKPKLTLTVSPAAIKAKHMAFLFNNFVPKKNDKLDGDPESSGPRKRSKSMTAQGIFVNGPLGASAEENLPVAKGLGPSITVNSPFGSSTGGYATGTYAASSSDDSARRKLLRCASLPLRHVDIKNQDSVVAHPIELVASALKIIPSFPSVIPAPHDQPSSNLIPHNNLES